MKNTNTKTLTRVALLVAIELVMKLVGLGSVPVGPLYMSFLTLPIAVGAITIGPAVGALLGGVFGAVSFYDAITGASYLILQSLDACNAVLAGDYPRRLVQCCVALEGLRRSLNKAAAARQCPVPLAVAGAQQEPMKQIGRAHV